MNKTYLVKINDYHLPIKMYHPFQKKLKEIMLYNSENKDFTLLMAFEELEAEKYLSIEGEPWK